MKSTQAIAGFPIIYPQKVTHNVTTDQTRNSLRIGNPDSPEADEKDIRDKVLTYDEVMALIKETQLDAEMLRRLLKTEIKEGQIDVESTAHHLDKNPRERLVCLGVCPAQQLVSRRNRQNC